MKKKKRIKDLIIILISVVLIGIYTNFVLYPAYLSTISSINPDYFEENYPNYYIAGQTKFNLITNETTITIYEPKKQDDVIHLNNKINYKILRHEYCHKNQFEREYVRNGINPYGIYILEFECYNVQYLPNSIFKLVYDFDDIS